jgi:uncharacterized protein (DUF885 family)
MSNAEFDQLAHGFIADYLEFYPSYGSALGLHLYDGRAGDMAPPVIDAWLRTLGSWQRRFAALDPSLRTGQAALDAALIEQVIREERFRWETRRQHERDPIWWSDPFDVTRYLKRNYAPLDERVRAMAAQMEELPRVVDEMRMHLRAPLAAPLVETGLDVFGGYRSFYERDVAALTADVTDGTLRARVDQARLGAIAALQSALGLLEEARGGATASFAIGEDVYAEMLRSGEMVDVPLDRLLDLGEAELARLTDDLRATAARIDPRGTPSEVMAQLGRHHPAEDRLIADTRAMLDDLRRFLIDRDIVSVPETARPLVEETPPFARWAFAMMDTSGPFEDVAPESYYYVTPPEADWPAQQREEWLTKFDYATLKVVSIHEAYPGHFIHYFSGVKDARSMPTKVFHTYTFSEGWAHYVEEMMLDAGADTTPQFRLAFLGEALVRQVRYLAAIRMHTRGMTVDEATRLFQERAFMEPAPARKEAVRGTFDPGYLAYTLGKYMMRKLRDDVRAERGAKFSLREFHDQVIRLGAPPLPLARRALLGRDSGQAL